MTISEIAGGAAIHNPNMAAENACDGDGVPDPRCISSSVIDGIMLNNCKEMPNNIQNQYLEISQIFQILGVTKRYDGNKIVI